MKVILTSELTITKNDPDINKKVQKQHLHPKQSKSVYWIVGTFDENVCDCYILF